MVYFSLLTLLTIFLSDMQNFSISVGGGVDLVEHYATGKLTGRYMNEHLSSISLAVLLLQRIINWSLTHVIFLIHDIFIYTYDIHICIYKLCIYKHIYTYIFMYLFNLFI